MERGDHSGTDAKVEDNVGDTLRPNADLDKTTCDWALTFEDGTIATIYDYKTNRTPMGLYEWHIGGHDTKAYTHVVDTIILHRDKLVRMVRDYERQA